MSNGLKSGHLRQKTKGNVMVLCVKADVPTNGDSVNIEIKAATSVVFIGANGSGKTRLGVFFDQVISNTGAEVHRVAAHRSLTLNPNVIPPSLEIARNRLLYGYDQGGHQRKHGSRFKGRPATVLLDDFEHLLAALYAENNDISIAYRMANTTGRLTPPPAKLDKLKFIWGKLLPHRELVILSGDIKTKTKDGSEYPASDMSDGERVIFYLIAQALLAKPNSLLIFDEPELHINKSILANLWDEIESARSDCGFLYITHDVEFAGSRHAATKYVLHSYCKEPNEAWNIELVPAEAEIPDGVVATIIGSRRPVLFVEGDGGSLDSSLYRRVYREFTVIPVGSCEQVIHTVSSFAARPQLHRIGCAGLIDADGRTCEEADNLESKGIYCLPVSEVENLILLPNVFSALAKSLKFSECAAQARLADLRKFVMTQATQQADEICLRHTRRLIDAAMKKIGLASTNIASLDAEFKSAVSGIDAQSIFDAAKTVLTDAIRIKEYETVLYFYDNKGLLAEAAKQVGYKQKALEEFIGRALRSDDSSELHNALKEYLPTVTPQPYIE